MRERRLVFGEVAELYDRHRPTYPPALIDDLSIPMRTRLCLARRSA
jgi:hypothetical protein